MCVTGERGQKVMQITDVRVRKVAKEGKLKAVVSITMDEEFVVHDIKVIEGEKGLFIAMPSKKAVDGEYRDIAHPINSRTRERIQNFILEKYEEALAEDAAEAQMVYVSAKKGVGISCSFLNVVCQNKLSAVCLKMSYDSYFLSVKITQDHLLTENAQSYV